MTKTHTYTAFIKWTGNLGKGTKGYKSYERSHLVKIENKPEILCSSDPAFLGDPLKHNPEELLLASLSSCHMLWYLHLCSQAGVVVLEYVDKSTATMVETENGGGHFTEITLHPSIVLANETMKEKADTLHEKANKMCFIANSVNFPIHHKATYQC